MKNMILMLMLAFCATLTHASAPVRDSSLPLAGASVYNTSAVPGQKPIEKTQRLRKQKQHNEGLRTEPLSLTGFLMAIAGILFLLVQVGFFQALAFLLLLAALILGIVGLGKFREMPGMFRGRGFAIASIVLGGGTILFSLIAVIFLLILFQ